MPHGFKGERTLMRIFIGESDKCHAGPGKGRPLHEVLLEFFRERNFAGATVVRAMAGFGAHSRVHTLKILRLSLDLPIVIEVVDQEERIQQILPDLDSMIDGGMVTLERVRVILYRPHSIPEDERWQHRIAGLEPDPESGGA
jgi:PII-like signaling protein